MGGKGDKRERKTKPEKKSNCSIAASAPVISSAKSGRPHGSGSQTQKVFTGNAEHRGSASCLSRQPSCGAWSGVQTYAGFLLLNSTTRTYVLANVRFCFGSGALFNVLFRIITPGNFQIAQRPAKAPGNGHFSLNKRQFVHVRVSASQGSGRLSLFRFPCRDVSLFLPFLSIARLVLAKLGYFVKFEIETYLKRPWSTSLIFNDENSNEALRKEQKTCSFIITFSLNDNKYAIMIPFCPM